MRTWKTIAMAAGISIGSLMLLGLLVLVFLVKHRRSRNRNGFLVQEKTPEGGVFAYSRTVSRTECVQDLVMEGIEMAGKWRSLYPSKPFIWSEYPALLAGALDGGWAAFALTYSCSSQCPVSSTSSLMCTKCGLGEAFQPGISWEIGPGTGFMQLVRLNPKLEGQSRYLQAVQSSLPLPGPLLGSPSFPQEGYFEVTIVAVGKELSLSESTEGDTTKLMVKPSEAKVLQDHSSKALQDHSSKAMAKSKVHANTGNVEEIDADKRVLGVGFTAGVAPPFRLPGADQGSVGLLSNGQVFLNGSLQYDGPLLCKRGWGTIANTTIGCGFSPLTRRVFFTLDGELAGEVKCSTREFNYPLHAMVASNYDITLLVNYGQCSFEFMPANNKRIADPARKFSRSASGNFDDSSDLFSIRRLDSHWWSGRRTASSSQAEAESDLFEIALHM